MWGGSTKWEQGVGWYKNIVQKQEEDNIVPNRKRIRLAKPFHVVYGNNAMSAQLLAMSLLGVRTVLRLERDAWSMANAQL